MGVGLLALPLSGYAAISAATSKTIQGTEPYFVLKNSMGEKIKLTNSNQLIGFQYKDPDGITQFANKNDAATDIIVDASMKMNELLSLVPIDNSQYYLSSVLNTSGSFLTVSDDDGDGDTDASGSITATLKENGTAFTTLPAVEFNPCKSYTLTITANADTGLTKLQAKTQYGTPHSNEYNADTATYTIKPNIFSACYAKPNLNPVGTVYNGDVAQWDPDNGFIAASTVTHPTTNTEYGNFPTTGFHGAEFELILTGTTAKKVIASSTLSTGLSGTYLPPSGNSDISIELSATDASTNVLNVRMIGPRDDTPGGNVELPTQEHTNTPIKLTTTTPSGENVDVYSFVIKKWYIARYGVATSFSGIEPSPTYCNNLYLPGKYLLAGVQDLTNAQGGGWIFGLVGNGNQLRRTIGGGLFPEWGTIKRDINFYPTSDFENMYYWVMEQRNTTFHYAVDSYKGAITNNSPTSISFRALCISPGSS